MECQEKSPPVSKKQVTSESCAQFWVLLPWKKGFCFQNEGYLGSKKAEEWNEGPREVESVTLCIPEKKLIKVESYKWFINQVHQPHSESVQQQQDFLLGVKNQISW